jgi:hypothetical protein
VRLDYTIPGKKRDIGSYTLISQTWMEVQSIGDKHGYDMAR